MSRALGLAAFEPSVDDFAALGKYCREYMEAQGIAPTKAGANLQV